MKTQENTAIELIAIERKEQFEKHGRTVEKDLFYNDKDQMIDAAGKLTIRNPLLNGRMLLSAPIGWDEATWQKMLLKPFKERCVIAAALLAAQIDVEIEHERRKELFKPTEEI